MLDVEWERCKMSSGAASAKVVVARSSAAPIALSPAPRPPPLFLSPTVPVLVPELV